MLCLLGPLAALSEEGLRPLKLRPKAMALLAYLALNETPVARRDLGRLISPEAEDPAAALRWQLNFLRSELPETVQAGFQIGRDSVHLDGPTDVATFRRGAKRVIEKPGTADARQVLDLYRGDLCADLAVSASAAFDGWLYVEQEGLRNRFRQAAHSFARWALANGRAQDAVEPLGKLVSIDPFFEDGHVLLIETYESLGQNDAASVAYQRYQRIMRQELQVEPRPSVAARFEAEPASGPTLPLEDLIPLRDVTVHVVEWPGDEPTILAIHGSAGNAYSLAPLGERLAPDVRFIALDLRGHGFSDKPPTGYGLDHHVEDIIELIKRLGLKRPILLGFSAGGAIAAFVATRIAVRGLILLEGVIGDRVFTESASTQAAPRIIGQLIGVRIKGLREYIAAWRGTRKPYSVEAEAIFDRFAPFELARLPDGSYRQRALLVALEEEWASVVEADGLGALAKVRCPVLIVYAPKPWIGGPYFTEEVIAAQLKAARSAQLFVAERSNHPQLIRDPEPELIERIKQFVRL